MTDRPGADPYVRGHGDLRWDALHYDLDLKYKVSTNRIDATALITVQPRETLRQITFDLHGLHVAKTTWALRSNTFAPWDRPVHAKFRQRQGTVTVLLDRDITPAQTILVGITYSGKPNPLRGPDGTVGWEELDDGAFVVSQPHGAPSWYPCNDRPSNKATYRIAVTADKEYLVASNGVLRQRDSRGGNTRWVYEMTSPMATYLATVQVGRYRQTPVPAIVPLTICAPHGVRPTTRTAFARQADMMTYFTECFGEYPFEHYRVVITDDTLDIPLEAQGVATFGRNHLQPTWGNERLVAHELAHQWFGNSLTLQQWRDIWLHEGFACYAEWLWSEQSGQHPVSHHVTHWWREMARIPADLVIGDPGAQRMFDDRVYKRGALAVQALRLHLGDERFFDLVRDWVAAYRDGHVSSEQFRAHARRHGGPGATDVLERWVFSKRLPPLHEVVHTEVPGV